MPTANELFIDTSASATAMANEIFGSGATVTDAFYFGDNASSGIFDNNNGGVQATDGVLPADTGVILSTGNAQDFTNSDGSTNTNQSAGTGTNTAGVNGDAQFNALAGGNNTFDASILLVEFTPTGDTLTVDFVISSEEYPEYINSQFLDVVGVWVNGVEATVSVGDGTASVGNINGNETPDLYNSNLNDEFNTEMDGFTVTLAFTAPVNVGQTNFLRIGVADVSDSGFDTNLLIAGGSVQTSIVAQDDSVTIGNDDTVVLDVLDNDSSTAGSLVVTHINGTSVVAGQTVTLSTGQDITLNADGTFTIEGDGDAETAYFNYTIQDGAGNEDTAIVGVTQVPCFVKGTLIDTVMGPVPVECLRPGMLVHTRDGGPQPLRWIGQRTVAAEGAFRPVRIKRGFLGAKMDTLLSPQHRVLIAHYWAELMFGEDEVLVKAKDLINEHSARPAHDLKEVTYLHMLFDEHQIITANGMECESYLPGQATSQQFDSDTQSEIVTLFPELASGFEGYGPAARTILKTPEALALCSALAA
ncbi:Hint domain-containing protein [Roseobacteraceae bacterium S113]